MTEKTRVPTTMLNIEGSIVIALPEGPDEGLIQFIKFRIPTNMLLLRVDMYSYISPTGGDLKMDIKKNNSSLFNEEGDKPTILDGESSGYTMDIGTAELNEGDLLTFYVDSLNGAEDISLNLKVKLSKIT